MRPMTIWEKISPWKIMTVSRRLKIRRDLYHAIDRLPERYRSVVIMKYFDDMKISEIARTLDIPEGTVKAYLSRARNELRLYLKEDYLGGLSVCK